MTVLIKMAEAPVITEVTAEEIEEEGDDHEADQEVEADTEVGAGARIGVEDEGGVEAEAEEVGVGKEEEEKVHLFLKW